MPQDTLGELVIAPWNLRVLSQPDVWVEILGATAVGIGVSLLVDERFDTSHLGEKANLFGHSFGRLSGYSLAGGIGVGLFEHVAIAEETLFRGMVQSRLARSLGETQGWLWGSLIFGGTHALNALFLPPDQRATYLAVGVPFITVLGSGLGHLGSHDAWDEYQREFRAYWIEGKGAGLAEDQMSTAPPRGPRSARANAIFTFLYGNPAYPYVQPAYDANTNGFREKVDAYFHPDGVNLTLSMLLFDLQREVESYTGTGFAAKRTAIQAKYALLPVGGPERWEVHAQNQWRRLVEAKFTNSIERSQIFTDLGVP